MTRLLNVSNEWESTFQNFGIASQSTVNHRLIANTTNQSNETHEIQTHLNKGMSRANVF